MKHENLEDLWCNYSGMPSPSAYAQQENENTMNKVYVRWNPLHEKVVCVHSSEESECIHCIEEREKVKGTAYSLEGKWFEVDSNNKLCYCGNPVDGSDPDCTTYGLCREHAMDA